jgi:hypothetical protein
MAIFSTVIAQAVTSLADQVVAADGGINTEGVVTFVATKIVPIVLAVIGLYITGKSARGNWSEAISTSGIAILGLLFIGGAFLLFAFGSTLAKTFFG